MQIDIRSALAKFAKMAASSDKIARDMPMFMKHLESEFNTNPDLTGFESLMNNVREIWEFKDDQHKDYISIGPFSYKNHLEKSCVVKGCIKIKPTQEFDYQFCVPFGDDVVKTLQQIEAFYEKTNYVQRYMMLFGFTNAKLNANKAMSDFVSYYMADFKQVGVNSTEEE